MGGLLFRTGIAQEFAAPLFVLFAGDVCGSIEPVNCFRRAS
jgi:hypothetical protein